MTPYEPSPTRRVFLIGSVALAAPVVSFAADDPFATSPWRRVSDEEWRRRLPGTSYRVLRHQDTEAPFSSPLNNEHRSGTFLCIGCGLPLFRSQWKFNSGTGWPSFFTSMTGALNKKPDYALGYQRTEYHCARCLGHQGHVFDDGPQPTGLRYCNNGVGLTFRPA